jgi:dephospho-CoA kinase|tara:strand:+ start:581 stop:1144 length:564 start_codon:yes stop_codon:yes gene_type:complete
MVAESSKQSYIKVAPRVIIMKIAIAGQMASGKTTLAESLVKIGYEKVSLAGKVKEIAGDLFHMEEKDRPLLQQIGMKMREIRPSVWIDYIIHLGEEHDNLVIDDVRFANEAKVLKQAGWTIIRLDIGEDLQKERLQNTYEDWEVHWNNRGDASEVEVKQISPDDVDLELDAGPDATKFMLDYLGILI